MAKKPGIYATMPKAPQKKRADRNPYPQQPVGALNPTSVPKREPRLGGFASKHGYGHAPHTQIGNLRLSGHKGAHMVGNKLPKAAKPK